MRFLVDQCTGPAVARRLGEQQHDDNPGYDEAPGTADDEITRKAFAENWMVITAFISPLYLR